MNCGPIEHTELARGRAVYNAHCYYCHGYSGDGRTVSAMMLDPPPRDFTAAAGLDTGKIAEAVALGRPGTAMQPFADVLSSEEINVVAAYVAERFVGCKDPNTEYHTPANGWPDHEDRYGAAYPFVEGLASIDQPAGGLTPDLAAGRALFLSACITCHEASAATTSPLGLHAPATPASEDAHGEDHIDDYEAKTIHDYPPLLTGLSGEEKRGRELYAAACAQCHAADGTGLNWIGKFLNPPPPDFTTAAFADEFDPADFAARTLEPPPDVSMPAFGRVFDEVDAAAIAAYVHRAFVGHAE